MNDSPESSLELLLDTITNAFGGILFLALLVVLLLRITSETKGTEAPTREAAANLSAAQASLIAAERERDELLRAVAMQEQLAGQLLSVESQEQLELLDGARESRDDLGSQRLSLAGALVATQNGIKQMDRQLQDLRERLAIKTAEAETTRQALEREIKLRTTSAKLPRLHVTTRMEVAVVLRYGRLYFVHSYDATLTSRQLNVEDMAILREEDGQVLVTPKPYRGIALDGQLDLRAALSNKLQPLPPQDVYLAVAVWDDSFGQFMQLKNTLVEMGYEYRVIPLEQGGMVVESNVDSPLVQ